MSIMAGIIPDHYIKTLEAAFDDQPRLHQLVSEEYVRFITFTKDQEMEK